MERVSVIQCEDLTNHAGLKMEGDLEPRMWEVATHQKARKQILPQTFRKGMPTPVLPTPWFQPSETCQTSNLQMWVFSLNLSTSIRGKGCDFYFTNEEFKTRRFLGCLSKYSELMSEQPMNSGLSCKICLLFSFYNGFSAYQVPKTSLEVFDTRVSLFETRRQVYLFIAIYLFFNIPCSYSTRSKRKKELLNM